MLKINLGSESQILSGFENLDPRWEQFPGAKEWRWNDRIPYEDNFAELIVVQHVLMFCHKDDYDKNLQEIYRVLCPGGIFLLKEENNKKYQWRKLGSKLKVGHIVGSTNLEEIVPILENNKFKVISTDPKIIVEKYNKEQKIINRLPKLFRNKLFVVECQK